MKKVIIAIVILATLALGSSAVTAATEAEILQSIEDGLAFLATSQDPDGSWGDQSGWYVGATGLCVKKFQHYALHSDPPINPLNPAYQYRNQVRAGLDYLFSQACIRSISVQPAGNPDSDGDGLGVYFECCGAPCGSEQMTVYQTGIALMALVENDSKDSIVDVPGSEVDGWTYYDVAVDAMDFLAYAQNDAGSERGGWGYTSNQVGWSDNSITGYAVLGLTYASAAGPEGYGLTVPAFVLSELAIWVSYIQCQVAGPDFGGSGYMAPCDMVNCLKTGNLLFEMALIGQFIGSNVNANNAVAYLVNHWNDANQDPGWQNHPQAMYAVMKGLEIQGAGQYLDPPANTIDWFDDLSDEIVATQNPDGSWTSDPHGGADLGTAWCLLTLEKAAPPPPMIPTLTEWGIIVFCVLLFGWMAWVVVRRRRKLTVQM